MPRNTTLQLLAVAALSTLLSLIPSQAAQAQATAYADQPPILLGAAWYPEQWPESQWDADLTRMEAAHIHLVRVGEFAWSTMEPGEGSYDFGWLDSLRTGDAKTYLIEMIENYRKGTRKIEGKLLNPSSLDRTEVCNMILFYKQILVSTRSLQLKNYILNNQKILQVLREDYSLENEGGKD